MFFMVIFAFSDGINELFQERDFARHGNFFANWYFLVIFLIFKLKKLAFNKRGA
jgi:hypothetical protein